VGNNLTLIGNVSTDACQFNALNQRVQVAS
jgi:hypothetical protein